MGYVGTYDRTIFYNPSNKYCIISVKTSDQSVPQQARSAYRHRDNMIRFIAVGYELPQTDKVSMILDGEWENGKHGVQLQVDKCEEIVPQTKEGVYGYLSSRLIKGVGEKTAALIVNRFGADALRVLENEPERLLEIRGITPDKLEDIKASYAESRCVRDLMILLTPFKDIIRVFPRTLSNTNTSLVLKTPKTKTSVRKIFLPSTVAQMLLERKKQIDEMKELFGDEYLDYDLVFCHSSGRPMEGQVINRALKKLIQDNDLPDVVFHSFRHASITYKLKWNGGDMKSVQGDSGHARMDMVADVYSHIIDEDRRYNAQKFEEQFYNAKGLKNAEEGKTAPMPKFETSVELLDPMAEVQKESEVEKEKPAENSTDENAALLTKLLSNPETAALLKALAKTI